MVKPNGGIALVVTLEAARKNLLRDNYAPIDANVRAALTVPRRWMPAC